MGSLAAYLGDPRRGRDVAGSMLAASPHRGRPTATDALGGATIGVATNPGQDDASIESDGRLVSAFVGRLENAAELTKRFERAGTNIRATSSAGLLLAAFENHGERAPELLRGAFAAVVSDGERMWFFRDQMGSETLFYRNDAGGIYVASEAKQVVAGSGISQEPDLEVLEAIYYSDGADHTRTAMRGVRRAISSTLLEGRDGHVRTKRYWYPERLFETARLSFDELVATFDALMEQACARTLTGQDAISLSGGIDSPGVAAFAAKAHMEMTGRPLRALSAVYPGFPSSDESRYIEEVAAYLDLPLRTYEPAAQRLDKLEEWVRLFDGPWSVWSPAGAEEQFGIAHDMGIRTILTGEMAEQVMAMQIGLVPYLLSKGRAAAALRYLRLSRAKGVAWRGIIRQVGATVVPRWAVAGYLRDRPLIAIPDWLDPDRASRGRTRHALPGRRYWPTAQLAAFGQGSSLALEASSILQARDGIRIRQPWADVDLWEFFVSLPAEQKFPEPQVKALVRKLLRGKVPDSIVDRKDKPVLNEWFEAMSLDYPALRRWLLKPKHRIFGVDYERLGAQLEREDMDLAAYIWAKDLAAIQAFVSLW
jgi:asparagine synthase (glutamine-hydrolysing)